MRKLCNASCIALLTLLTLSCRGKQGPEGPQGPPGQNLVRPQQGFIEGVARGRDQNGTPFNIPFRYTYYAGNPGEVLRRGADTLDIQFDREDSLGIGRLSFSLILKRSTSQASVSQLSGVIANINASPIPTFSVQAIPQVSIAQYPGTTQTVTGVQISGDTLLIGDFTFIRPQYTPPNFPIPGLDLSALANAHPDTVTGRFSVRLLPIIRYGRAG
ncbi:MAG: hypothetical protein N3E49_07125 [Bacteroidia bacterium]|nr:hypothetical protein [Bacteroidia bacterium]